MKEVNMKIDKITKIWNFFILEVEFLQDKINFNQEVATNYYGDILYYFKDTLDLIKVNKIENDNFKDGIFNVIGLMQIIYAHQDLTDELLYIFKLQQSSKKDKLPNRKIRNELVGHPVNRSPVDNKLQSSVIFGKNNGKGYIHYIKYERENNFSFKDVKYSIKDIINYHKDFLNKYLDKILKKLHNILKSYKKSLENILKIVLKENQFLKVLNLAKKYYPYIFKYNFLFQKEILLDCYEKRSNHFRYEKAINDFLLELESGIRETINRIEEILTEKKESENYK